MSGITGTSTTLSGLTQGTRYYIWVAAVSSGGQGCFSTRVSETTFSGIIYTLYCVYKIYIYMKAFFCSHYPVPGPPTNLMISPPSWSCDVLEINWTAPANTGDGLPVNYKLYLNEYSLIEINNVVSISDLSANTEYNVTVVAFNELGEGGNVTGTGRTRPEGINKKHVAIRICTYFV